MLDRNQLAPHEPDGQAEQHQGEADLRQHVGEARAEGEAYIRHVDRHDVAVIELDLDQDLVAADVVVDEVGLLEIGIERPLHFAGDDVVVARRLEGRDDALPEADIHQHVRARVLDDPLPLRVAGKVGMQRDQHTQVAHQNQRETVGDVVAALAVEPPGRQRLQQQHRHDDDDQSAREQRLRRAAVDPTRDPLEEFGEPIHLVASFRRRPGDSPGLAPFGGSAGSQGRARSCDAIGSPARRSHAR